MDKTNLRCLLLHKKRIFPLFLSLVLVGGCGVGGESAEPVATAITCIVDLTFNV